MIKNYTTKQVARLLGVCSQRILAKIKQGHFPGAHTCECGRSLLIPQQEVENEILKKTRS